jgi:3-keto-5-aminohexanoate cleavage enzyme
MDDLIICFAPCPGDKAEEKFPTKMDVVDEVIRSHDAGASIVHLHVRDESGYQTTDTTLFQRQVEGIHAACPVIIEGSTGGTPEHTLEERCVSIGVPGIELGSLNMGSVNLFGGVYQNPMSDIRYYAQELNKNNIRPSLCIFDLSMLNNARRLHEERLLDEPLIYNLIFDVPDALPYSKKYLDIFLDQMPANSVWFLTRHHAPGWVGFRDALERGGHVRVGFEDGPFISSEQMARSNVELVEDIVQAAESLGRKVVGTEKTREICGMDA